MDELDRLFEHAREVRDSLPPVAAQAFRETVAPALDALRRGAEVLHAAAVALDGGALLICGRPGAGKSTLAARLLLGHPPARYIADDAAAMTPQADGVVVHPSIAPLRITPDVGRALVTRLGGDVHATTRGRVAWSVPGAVRAPGPVPISSVVILDERADGPTRLAGVEAARRILGHLYIPGFADGDRHRRILRAVGLLAASRVVIAPRAAASAGIPQVTP